MELSKYLYLKYQDKYDWDIKEKDFEQELKEDPVWQRYINCGQIALDVLSDVVNLLDLADNQYEVKKHLNSEGYCLKLNSINAELDIEVSPTLNLIEFKSSKILISLKSNSSSCSSLTGLTFLAITLVFPKRFTETSLEATIFFGTAFT